MILSTKLTFNRTSREIIKEISRQISKTSTATNSDAITRQENKMNLDLNTRDRPVGNNKWNKLSRLNNIRALSTIQTKAQPAGNVPMFSKEETREFLAVFPDIVRDLTDAGRHTDIPEVTKRFVKVLQYNVPNGKKNRGLTTVVAYKMFEKPENLTPENIRLANILGWCIELLQSSLLVADDIMDGSDKRRGQLAWHKNEDVGLYAINDGILMDNSLYSILRKYFSKHECYVQMIELFHDVTFKTSLGQMLDGMCMKNDRPDLDKFTMTRYKAIVKYKTGYYTFQLPVALAMYLARMTDSEQHRQAQTILMEMGEFFQIQDDFLDTFGDQEVMGKGGSDIKDGKCSWLSVVALQRANSAQRKLMEDHYGRPDPESVQIVRNLYEELHLPATYAVYEEESFNIIRTHIQQISKGLPHELFFKIMRKLYKRHC